MDYDLCVIGGGINGAGIARDAAGRGLSVLIVEAQDFASATSSASTKLVHGGLRYLEHYEFRLVKESLNERETLLSLAPHIVWPMKFILPHNKNLRPYWMIKMGLFLYDWLGGRKRLSKSEALDFATSNYSDPLNDEYTKGFSYADCWVDDARLVILNVIDAYERGAHVMPRTACLNLKQRKDKQGWKVSLKNLLNGDEFDVTAKAVVNAGGPWVRQILDSSKLAEEKSVPNVRLVRGSHIVFNRLYEGDHTYIFQQPDGRIIFTIPYEHNYTLVGTTDAKHEGSPSEVKISDEEIDYLCEAVNRSLKVQVNKDQVLWSYSGVRSLVDDGQTNASKVTRDYKLHLDESFGAPMLSVFGGKITTYRKLAEHAMDKLSATYWDKNCLPWTKKEALPGGDIDAGNFDKFFELKQEKYPYLPEFLLHRYARAYGTRMDKMLGEATSLEELGAHYGDHVYEAEILYMMKYEFAIELEDILWRRSKLGLHINDTTLTNLEIALPQLHSMLMQEQDRYENASSH